MIWFLLLIPAVILLIKIHPWYIQTDKYLKQGVKQIGTILSGNLKVKFEKSSFHSFLWFNWFNMLFFSSLLICNPNSTNTCIASLTLLKSQQVELISYTVCLGLWLLFFKKNPTFSPLSIEFVCKQNVITTKSLCNFRHDMCIWQC